MDRKIETSILGAIVIILLIGCMIAMLASDNKKPVIKFSSEAPLTYTEGQGDDVLLTGVTAVDERDGDVSDSLIVANKVVVEDGKKLKVTYAAKDKKNNIAKESRLVDCVPSDGSTESGGENGETNGAGIEDNTEPESTTLPQPVSTGAAGEVDKAAADADGIPVIKLKATEADITVGQQFDPMSYVRETYDNSGDVSRRIRVTGDYDLKNPGDYQITYTVSDTEGNVSEPAVFTLHVLPAQKQN